MLVISLATNASAQNEQESAPDFGKKMGEIFNEAFQETLEEAIPGSTTIKTPDLFNPTNGQSITHFPRNMTFTWEQIQQSTYEIQIDCLGCKEEGKWSSDLGQYLAYANNIAQPFYNYEFPDDRMGRWRVRAVRNNTVSEWTEWSYFNFNSGAGSVQNTDPYNNENTNTGWEGEQYDPYGEDPYQGYDDPYENQQGEQPPDYEEGVTNEPQQSSQNVPVAGENPNQGAVAPPQADVPEVQVNTNTQNKNNSVIKKIPKSVLVKPAENPGSTSSQSSGTEKKKLYKPIDE